MGSPAFPLLRVLRAQAQAREDAREEGREGDVRPGLLRGAGGGGADCPAGGLSRSPVPPRRPPPAGGRVLPEGDGAGLPEGVPAAGADCWAPLGAPGLWEELPGGVLVPRVCSGGFGSRLWSGATSSSMAWKTDSTSPPTSVSCAGSLSRSLPHASRWERENDDSFWIGPSEPSRSYAAWRSRWPSSASCFTPARARRIAPRDSWSRSPSRPRSISLRASDRRFEAWSR